MGRKNYKKTYIPTEHLRDLSQRSDIMGALLVLLCWSSIFISGAIVIMWPNIFTLGLAIFLIGARQLGMAILMHDAAHGILFKTPAYNKFIGQFLLTIPIGVDMLTYRKYHLKHHLHSQQKDDPDLVLSAPFPITKYSLMRNMLRDIFDITALKLRIDQILLALKPQNSAPQTFDIKNILPPYIANLIMFMICWALGYWWVYFLLWLLPLFTTFQLVLRIRNIAEHAMASHDKNPLTNARTTKANWLARIFIAPYWVNYHVEYHAYMFVPYWQLKSLHAQMIQEGHQPNMEIKKSYFDVLRTATSAY